ncbi:hypothetical protein Ancab_005840 [Ancistrocladus abbreviatus]
MSSSTTSYWCYRCNRFVGVENRESIICADCYGGFIEEIDSPLPDSLSESRRRRFPGAAMYMIGNSDQSSGPRLRSSRRNGGDRSPFNPVIVLRGPAEGGGAGDVGGERGGYELYYDDGGGSGLRPLPASVSDFLLGSGFDRLLDQLAQIEINGLGSRAEQPPASKAAMESMPTIEIVEAHVRSESHCAVCKEPFELGSEAREMPCKHIYHADCILPWLSLRNSCPVCRHELPADSTRALPESESSGGQDNGRVGAVENEEETVGLTIWRLPGGGFAVGRFSGGRNGAERELPVVYTEMDGGFNSNQGGVPRRVSWGSRGGRSRQNGGGLRQTLRNWFACFGGGNHSSESTSSNSDSRINHASRSPSIFSAMSRRRRREFEVDNEIRRW